MIPFPVIDPVAFEIGPLRVHWYGLAYLAGLFGAVILGKYRADQMKSPISRVMVTDIVVHAAFGAIIGGRLGYALFYDLGHMLASPLDIVKIWEGGMSFHGGFAGALVGLWLYAYRKHLAFFQVTDFVAPLIAVGLFFGRIANFVNQELWGRPTDLPWGIVFPFDPDQLARHPSQLYEAALEGLLLFTILWLYSREPRKVGAVSGLFLVCYGTFRFLVEFVREPDVGLGFIIANWVTMGQLLSTPLIIAGIAIWVAANRNYFNPKVSNV